MWIYSISKLKCSSLNGLYHRQPRRGQGHACGVFAAGFDGSDRATVWKDNAVIGQMWDTGGFFNSVWVSGSAVHAVGQTPDGRPFYWRSGNSDTFYVLGSGQGCATSVCVSEGRVFVAGWDATGGKVWKDGAQQYDLGIGSRPWGISVPGIGNSVYAAGYDDRRGCIWLNGELIDTINDESAALYSIDVSGGVFYAAGECAGCPAWKKAGDPGLRFLGSGGGLASSLRLSEDYLYIAGHDDMGGRVWRGLAQGTIMSTYVGIGGGAEPESVFVFDGDVYSSGWKDGGRVWRNSMQIRDFGAGSNVYSIFSYGAVALSDKAT